MIEEAGTSRTTFYKHFEDKHDCFLAAYEMLVEQVFAEVVADCDGDAALAAADDATGWRRSSSSSPLDPELARTAVVEVAAAGADARQLHWDAVARFTEYLDDGRELAGGRELPENISLMSAGAVSGLIFDELLAGRAAQLPDAAARPALRDARPLHRAPQPRPRRRCAASPRRLSLAAATARRPSPGAACCARGAGGP